MEREVPWSLWVAKIAPHYPAAGRGRRPYPLETLLRSHLMRQWFGYSDPAMEEALHDVPMLRCWRNKTCLRQGTIVDADSGLAHTLEANAAKVRYPGLSKNAQQFYLLFVLGNLYLVRRALMAA